MLNNSRVSAVYAAVLGVFLLTALGSTRAQSTNIFPPTGSVGIGTTSPGSKLDIINNGTGVSSDPGDGKTYFGSVAFNREAATGAIFSSSAYAYQFTHTGSTTQGLDYLAMQVYTPAGGGITPNALVVNGYGNVGIGTTNPVANLTVGGGVALADSNVVALFGSGLLPSGLGQSTQEIQLNSFNDSAKQAIIGNLNGGLYFEPGTASGNNAGMLSFYYGNGSALSLGMVLNNSGNVGIGTPSPTYPLSVNGVIQSTTGGVIFPDATTQTTAWTGVLCGGDYAESVGVSGEWVSYKPGDVLVIDPDSPDGFTKSAQPYSTGVAGVYSTKHGVIGRKSTDPAKAKTEIPMAMIGIVPTKVSAENGPIKRGDLLVTSATLGYAMKGTDRSQTSGAIVGKALESLISGTGMIDVLVTLQ
jgi:hypothetical protein